jgi:hypothetical protein
LDRSKNGRANLVRDQLTAFQSHVWKIKLLEVLGLAAFGLACGYWVLFLLDRFVDTSSAFRWTIATLVFAGWLLLPWAFHRWVWRYRRLDQVARLIRKRSASFGDEILGVIELSQNAEEQQRSPALCAAAIQQVAERVATRDLIAHAPRSRHRGWLILTALVGGLGLMTLFVVPQAAWNALTRLILPWQAIDRFTFAQLEPIPRTWVVPHGEPSALPTKLKEHSPWSPTKGTAKLTGLSSTEVNRVDRSYEFRLPPVSEATSLRLRIGDYTHAMELEPRLRPELQNIAATVLLPDYLQSPEPIERDLRSGAISVVVGSKLSIQGEANRSLQRISMQRNIETAELEQLASQRQVTTTEDLPIANAGLHWKASPMTIGDERTTLAFDWQDEAGLKARQPFQVLIQALPDAAPIVTVEDLPRQAIVLNTEQLNFRVVTNDDFGIREAGLEWWEEFIDEDGNPNDISTPSLGWRRLADGAPNLPQLTSQGSFRPIDWGIESKSIELRGWAVDYLPDRIRNYSAVHRLLVLRPDEHALWITEQLNQWHHQSLDVRDRELQLYQVNRELRELSGEELRLPENQRRLQEQVSGESANQRRLRGLTQSGAELLQQAARNPELGVGHLERWAEMLKLLQSISNQRMPKVSDLLQQAAKAASQSSDANKKPIVGEIRNQAAMAAEQSKNDQEKKPDNQMPSLVDVESSLQPKDQEPAASDDSKSSSPSKFSLPTTTLIGPAEQSSGEKKDSKPEEKLEAAVQEQAELLAEFDRLAEELGKILSELEGSTLVKRLKAASREQIQVAQGISKELEKLLAQKKPESYPPASASLEEFSEIEMRGSEKVSYIMDDLEAFQQRRRLAKFQRVLGEMKDSQVIGALQSLSADLSKEHGISIAQAEFWADNLDRWAEDLVDPAAKGECPGSKDGHSLPPSIVLEVLQILEGQVNLREETRVAEQARSDDLPAEHVADATKLADKQIQLRERTEKAGVKIEALPEGAVRFPNEIQLLVQAIQLMNESTDVFMEPDTGSQSLAVQTEIIELLLQSNRINPKASGGANGKSPGGGGQGDTADAAIALVGAGINNKGQVETREVSQSVGKTTNAFPEEFRDGLNDYFNRLEADVESRPSQEQP